MHASCVPLVGSSQINVPMVVGSLPLRAIHVPCTRFPEPGHPMPFSPCRPATHSNSKRKHDAYCNLVQHVECRGRRPIYCRKNFIIWGGDGKRICMTRTTDRRHRFDLVQPLVFNDSPPDSDFGGPDSDFGGPDRDFGGPDSDFGGQDSGFGIQTGVSTATTNQQLFSSSIRR